MSRSAGPQGPQGFDPGGFRLALPALTPVVRVLLIANVAVQVVQFILAGRLSDWLGASVTAMAEPPWLLRLLTYQFVHQYHGLWHLVMNMLVLYLFGTMVEEALGRRRFLRLYLLCGLSGGIFWLLASLVMGMTGVPVVGASGCVYGVITYAAGPLSPGRLPAPEVRRHGNTRGGGVSDPVQCSNGFL